MKPLFVLGLCWWAWGGLAVEVPYGHKEFYPTPARPVGWRGDGTGQFSGATPVLTWDEKSGQNVLWKLKLPFGYGQPIVVGDRVFAQADPDVLYAFATETGKLLWQNAGTPVTVEEEKTTHRGWFGWYGASFPTPVSDGRFVWAKFGQVIACYTVAGERRWEVPVQSVAGKGELPVASTQSLFLAGDRLVYLGGVKRVTDSLVALDPATGKELWRTPVVPEAGNESSGAAMPVTLRLDGVDLVVTRMGDAVRVVDGKRVGTGLFVQPDFKPLSYDMTTPVNREGQALVRLQRAGDGNLYVAGRQLRFADATREKLVAEQGWAPRVVEARDGNGPKFPTQIQHLLFSGGYWYLQGWPDLMTVAARDGQTVAWRKAPRELAGHVVWHEFPTPHRAGNYIFTGDRNGYVAVYAAAPEWKRVALNRVEANWHSNPFFQGDQIYIRTQYALYCLGPTTTSEKGN